VAGITIREVVADTIKEASIKVEVAISTKILGTTTIAMEAATAEAAVAMAVPMKVAVAATLTIREAEVANPATTLHPSTVRAVQAQTGETTTEEAQIATAEVAATAAHMKKAVNTKVAREALISTKESLLALHLLNPKEARELGIREEDTAIFSNSGSTPNLKKLKPQPKIMGNNKKSENSQFSYF
jgi:hypothetical protein